MDQIIDLTPYLPAKAAAPRKVRRKFGSIAAAVECVVTICIGIGFFLFLAAFLAAV